jgi:hypothetical protein
MEAHVSQMKKISVLVLGTTVLLANAPAKADWTGTEMLPHCTVGEQLVTGASKGKGMDAEDGLMAGMCMGAITGIKLLANMATKNTDHPVCVPSDVTDKQALSVVVQHLRSHPETRENRLVDLVMDALVSTWPCPKGGKGTPKVR